MVLKSNKAMCKKCNDIIESKYLWDSKTCKCGAIAIDGGKSQIRHSGDIESIEDLSVWFDENKECECSYEGGECDNCMIGRL